MNKEASTNHSNKSSEISKVGLCLNLVVGYLAPAVILFGSAGRLDLPMFWAYVMLLWGLGLVGFVVIIKKHPDLIKERLHPGSGTKESLRFLKAINIATWVGHLLVAGLDVGRFHWSGEITLRIRIVGLAVFAGAMGIAQWSGAANRFAYPSSSFCIVGCTAAVGSRTLCGDYRAVSVRAAPNVCRLYFDGAIWCGRFRVLVGYTCDTSGDCTCNTSNS